MDHAIAHGGYGSFRAADGHESHVFFGIHAIRLQDHAGGDFGGRPGTGGADHLAAQILDALDVGGAE
ncbi:hypothetical protein D3C83_33210 [compost metagenome]